MEKLIHLFTSILPLSHQDIELIESKLIIEMIEKDIVFSPKGKICKKLSFVNDGILKVLKTDEKGNLFIPYFITPNHFAVDIDSYTNQTLSEEDIISITPCHLITITKKDYGFLEDNVSNFSKIIHLLKEKALVEKMKLKSEMLVDDATTKYKKLLKNQPQIIQQVPQSQIALFLGISQYTLSRIKSKR